MKKFQKLVSVLGVFGLLLGMIGCAHTPENRIAKNPEVFERLTAEEQELVRSGEVELGFTPEMVFLALGEPDRKVTRRTADEVRQVWYYEGRFVSAETVRVRDQYGRFRPVRPTLYLDRTVEHIYTRARLEFVEGKLVSVEQTER